MSRSTQAFASLSVAILKGFLRDRASVFFAIVFPLMFLVLFGGILGGQGQSRIDMVEVGRISAFDDLPAGARESFQHTFEVTHSSDLDEAIAQVRKGDVDVAVQMKGDVVVAHYTQTDRTAAAMTQGALASFVDAGNLAASGQPPRWRLDAQRVEDESLQEIQFATPGLLGWAVAMSASFGAAATLQGWRQSKLLRRLQLAPVSTRTVVGARVAVTVGIALVQMAIFVGVGAAGFGLQLSGAWPAAVPLLVVGTLCFMAVGLLAGAVARSTEGAVNMANFCVLPMSFLSGSFFPLQFMPHWLQVLSLVLPLRHLNEGMLDVMVRGEGPAAVLLPMAVLAGFTLVLTLLAAKLFRWESV